MCPWNVYIIKDSKQVNVVEYIAYNRIWEKNPTPPDSLKLKTIARYYYNGLNNTEEILL